MIKFRFWDNYNKRWLDPQQYSVNGENGDVHLNGSRGIIGGVDIQQYINIKDRNDVEVYEGDHIKILTHDSQIQNMEVICKVEMRNGSYCGVVTAVNLWELFSVSPPEIGSVIYFLNIIGSKSFEVI